MGDTTCPSCGRPRSTAEPDHLAWSTLHGRDGSVAWFCPDCTRSVLAEIEALLPTPRPTGHLAAAPLRPAA